MATKSKVDSGAVARLEAELQAERTKLVQAEELATQAEIRAATLKEKREKAVLAAADGDPAAQKRAVALRDESIAATVAAEDARVVAKGRGGNISRIERDLARAKREVDIERHAELEARALEAAKKVDATLAQLKADASEAAKLGTEMLGVGAELGLYEHDRSFRVQEALAGATSCAILHLVRPGILNLPHEIYRRPLSEFIAAAIGNGKRKREGEVEAA